MISLKSILMRNRFAVMLSPKNPERAGTSYWRFHDVAIQTLGTDTKMTDEEIKWLNENIKPHSTHPELVAYYGGSGNPATFQNCTIISIDYNMSAPYPIVELRFNCMEIISLLTKPQAK